MQVFDKWTPVGAMGTKGTAVSGHRCAERVDMSIAVLAGGCSHEREVSLASGRNAAVALRKAGFGTVDLMDPADPAVLTGLADRRPDAVFLALHGKGGEDGTIQGALEFLNLPYTGSNPMASACAVDKDLAKILYARAGVPTAPGVPFMEGDPIDADAVVCELGHELFVKPAINGSSYGVRLVKDPHELAGAVAYAHGFGDKVLVEQRVVGTEVTVGVLGDGKTLRALPVVEIRTPEHCEFYDLDVKYVDPTDIHRIPARLDEATYAQVQELAVRAHRSIGCFGFSRSDFIVSDHGPVILETNTIPGMTPTSLFPDEVRHAGLSFAEVCAELVDLAIERAQR